MDANTDDLMNKRFEEMFYNWTQGEGKITHSEPELEKDSYRQWFDKGFPTKEELFSYVRHMPPTDRENFIRLQLKFMAIPGITVHGGSLTDSVATMIPKMVSSTAIELAQNGYLAIHNDVDFPVFERVEIFPFELQDPTKGYYVVGYYRDTRHQYHRKSINAFTYTRLVSYVAVGITEYVANNFGPEEGSLEPSELHSILIDLIIGGRNRER